MSSNHITFSLSRFQIPNLLYGFENIDDISTSKKDIDPGVSFKYEINNLKVSGGNPALIVLDEMSSDESLSWFKTFAPQIFPLTQFSRVVGRADYENFSSLINNPNKLYSSQSAQKWSNLIVGEILSQSDSELSIGDIPTSRYLSCLTTAIARSWLNYDSDGIYITCVDRIREFEVDQRFVKRNVQVADLLPVWALCQVDFSSDYHISVEEVVKNVCDAAQDYSIHTLSEYENKKNQLFITDYPALFNDSIEGRVLAFNKLHNDINNVYETKGNSSIVPNVLIAGAAFLVGRGTSHHHLLRKVAENWNSAYLWFSLMAAFAGPKYWDNHWARLAKFTERNIKTPLNLFSPPSSDLSWTEFKWLARKFSGIEVFEELPKAASRALSVEVVPGMNCQLLLNIPSKSSNKINNNELLDLKRSQEVVKSKLHSIQTLENELQLAFIKFNKNNNSEILNNSSMPNQKSPVQKSFIDEKPLKKIRARKG